MIQTVSKKRKVMCVFSSILVIIFTLIYVFEELDSSIEKMPTDHVFVVSIAALAVIHICDMLSVFSDGFRGKFEALERKILFLPIIEVAVLVISIGGLFVGAGGLVLMLFVIGLMGGEVVLAIIGIVAISIVITINMIAIIKTKMLIVKNKNVPAVSYQQNVYPNQQYPNQPYSGIESLGALDNMGSYDSQTGNNFSNFNNQ